MANTPKKKMAKATLPDPRLSALVAQKKILRRIAMEERTIARLVRQIRKAESTADILLQALAIDIGRNTGDEKTADELTKV